MDGENSTSTSGPQPYRAEITNQITPEIPTLNFQRGILFCSCFVHVKGNVLRYLVVLMNQ